MCKIIFRTWCIVSVAYMINFWPVFINAQETKAQALAETRIKITALEKAERALNTVHTNLQESRDQIERLRDKATINFQNNAYKVYLKGVLDIYDKVSGPGSLLNEALSMTIEVYKNIVWEPKLWKGRNEKVSYIQMHDNALKRSGKIRRMVGDLGVIMQAPLERFDDDKYPLRSSKSWWRDPDGTTDDNTELATRKMVIIKNLSEKTVKQMDLELKVIREERKQILATIQQLKRSLPDTAPQSTTPLPKPVSTAGMGDKELKTEVTYYGDDQNIRSRYSYYVKPGSDVKVKHGPIEIYYVTGELETRGGFENGKENGQWQSFHKNGQTQNTLKFRNGKTVGIVHWFHTNGQPAGINSYNENGQPYGVHKNWYANGVLSQEIHYESGQQVLVRKYGLDGKLLSETRN